MQENGEAYRRFFVTEKATLEKGGGKTGDNAGGLRNDEDRIPERRDYSRARKKGGVGKEEGRTSKRGTRGGGLTSGEAFEVH